MPAIFLYALVALLGTLATQLLAQDDRYADRYPATTPSASQDHDGEASQPLHEPATETAAEAPADWQDESPATPTRTLHALPFRWQRVAKRDPHVQPASAVMLPSASGSVPNTLSKPKDARPLSSPRDSRTNSESKRLGTSPTALIGSVAVVLGLFVLVVWFTRRGLPKQPPTLPREALEVLGRQRLFGKQELQLVRLGKKLVLLNITPGHTESLAEVTDAEEVDRLAGLCYQQHPHSTTHGFQQLLREFSTDPAPSRRATVRQPDKLDLTMFDSRGN